MKKNQAIKTYSGASKKKEDNDSSDSDDSDYESLVDETIWFEELSDEADPSPWDESDNASAM